MWNLYVAELIGKHKNKNYLLKNRYNLFKITMIIKTLNYTYYSIITLLLITVINNNNNRQSWLSNISSLKNIFVDKYYDYRYSSYK